MAEREAVEARPKASGRRFRLRIVRQGAPSAAPHTDEFAPLLDGEQTIADLLATIDEHPVTVRGQAVLPVAWEAPCLEGRCGLCTLRANGRAVQACTTFVSDVLDRRKRLVLEPLRKLPLVRDLVVDRTSVLSPASGAALYTEAEQEGRDVSAHGARRNHAELVRAAACTGCGACVDACPVFGPGRSFLGPAYLNAVQFYNDQPVEGDPPGDAELRARRLESAMGKGGVQECGKAEVCVDVCPVGVPLVDALQRLGAAATRRMFLDWFSR